MEKITGNFLTQANKDFPLDCETLDYLQKLAALAAIAGNVAGDRVVLWGCEANSEGTRRGAGYVFIRTKSAPEGEILPWEGGPTANGMYLKQDAIPVSANNVDYPKAYTRRSLAPGIGEENFDWESFIEIKNIRELMSENQMLREELAAVQPAPLGTIQMWAGVTVPDGYVLCNGQALRETDYPELRKALGTAFNSALSANGTAYTTQTGYFRVPDLRGRFIVGQHDSDNDYKTLGNGGGSKAVALVKEQLPDHTHSFKDYYFAESHKKVKGNYDNIPTNSKIGSNDTDYDNDYLQYYVHETESTGQGQTHENRPPYFVLAYIMRTK
ncbi:MAG: tail fiber protein [Bacteroides sp.]|nr:tail fiber protein [Bacteroides sp.]